MMLSGLKIGIQFVVVVTITLCIFSYANADESRALQDHQQLNQLAVQFLKKLPTFKSDVQIEINSIDDSLVLTACDDLDFATPSKYLEGNFRLKVQCQNPDKWSVFLGVKVLQPVKYYVLNRSVDSSHPINSEDLQEVVEYHSHTNPSLCDEKNQILGLKLIHALKAGSAIRFSDLGSEPALSRGQTVTVISKGKGFEISRAGRLLSNSFEGQTTKVQVASRQIISGIARKGGIIEVR